MSSDNMHLLFNVYPIINNYIYLFLKLIGSTTITLLFRAKEKEVSMSYKLFNYNSKLT